MNLKSAFGYFFTVVFIGLVIFIAYLVYLFNYQESYFQEVTEGSYKNYSIGETKESTIPEIKGSLSKQYGNNLIRISLRNENNVVNNKMEIKANNLNNVDSENWYATDIWVFYYCEENCYWYEREGWISFKFKDEKLFRVAESKRRVFRK